MIFLAATLTVSKGWIRIGLESISNFALMSV
jgi:hypothetical protein